VVDDRSGFDAVELAVELAAMPREGVWFEFKVDNDDPDMVGEYASALSNGAVLSEKGFGYLVWGVRDGDHAIVGRGVSPLGRKVGNESFENWLVRGLAPQPQLDFFEGSTDEGRRIVMMRVAAAIGRPTTFKGVPYIRVGSHKKKLSEHPDHERRLWQLLDKSPYEGRLAMEHLPEDAVTDLLDYPSYFQLTARPLPDGRAQIVSGLAGDRLVARVEGSGWAITNLGALLFAHDLGQFPGLSRRAPRVVQYRGNDRRETVKEQSGVLGYAKAYPGMINYIHALLPDNEVVGAALRTSTPLYPTLAIRELVANALVHQDLTISGTGPLVELFDDRMEISNPGQPLIEPLRFIDSPPRSRNEALAALMRRIGVCEERGSGWDKVAFEAELYQLPAPLVETYDAGTRTVLFAPRPLTKMERSDRVRAVYQHASLRFIQRQPTSNATIRTRFGIEDRNKALASRLLKEAVEEGLISVYDASVGSKAVRYVPFWAGAATDS